MCEDFFLFNHMCCALSTKFYSYCPIKIDVGRDFKRREKKRNGMKSKSEVDDSEQMQWTKRIYLEMKNFFLQ
jgi:hypothetical protein